MDLDKIYKLGGKPLSKIREEFVQRGFKDDFKLKCFREFIETKKYETKERFGDTPDWPNIPIKDKVYHGWNRVNMFTSEAIINNRWGYWFDIRLTHEVENKPIPQLRFYYSYDNEFKFVASMIKKCLDYPKQHMYGGSRLFYLFIDWLLYGFGSSLVKDLPNEIDDDLNKYWYENFIGDMMFMYPSDYFVNIASEIYDNKAFNSGAFYPTPGHIVDFMVKITYTDVEDNKEKCKYASVVEPCMGSGIMLLYQSNYSLRLYGQDIDLLMVKIATVNGYLYMPWLVESDPETDKLLSDMHDKYWNGNEDLELYESLKASLNKTSNNNLDMFKNINL